MESDGILKAWTTKVLTTRAIANAMIMVSAYSRTLLFCCFFATFVLYLLLTLPLLLQ